MKSIITLLGAFFFAIFLEGFIRIIITFYHQEPFSLFGISSLPGFGWVAIIYVAVFIIYWICSMLIVTITDFSPTKHLYAFGMLALLWRVNEFFQLDKFTNLAYSVSISLVILVSIVLASFVKQKINASTSD